MKKVTAIISAAALTVCAVMPAAASAVYNYTADGLTINYDYTDDSYYDSIKEKGFDYAGTISSIESNESEVYIHDSVTSDGKTTVFVSLGPKAMALNTSMNSVKLPSYLVDIGDYSFQGCLNLASVEFPSTLETLGVGTFMSCTSLETISIGGNDSSMVVIPERCFYSCTSLKKVTIGDGIKNIGSESFFGCPVLDITIPPTVTFIGKNAIGVHADPHTGEILKYKKVVIRGESGSYAESYANANGIDFLDENNCLMGDVDENGFISSTDASAVLKAYSLMSTGSDSGLSLKQEFLADFNNDKHITASDASAILAEYAKIATM